MMKKLLLKTIPFSFLLQSSFIFAEPKDKKVDCVNFTGSYTLREKDRTIESGFSFEPLFMFLGSFRLSERPKALESFLEKSAFMNKESWTGSVDIEQQGCSVLIWNFKFDNHPELTSRVEITNDNLFEDLSVDWGKKCVTWKEVSWRTKMAGWSRDVAESSLCKEKDGTLTLERFSREYWIGFPAPLPFCWATSISKQIFHPL